MPIDLKSRRFRLNLAGALVLALGVLAATWIYFHAAEDDGDVIGYVVVNGESYPLRASDSKRYRADLERFGGKAAVFADDLNRWVQSLFQGRRLAFTIAVSAIAVSAVCFRVARRH